MYSFPATDAALTCSRRNGRVHRLSTTHIIVSATILLHVTTGCRRQSDQQEPPGPRSTTAPLFTEITEQTGLDFVHHPGFGADGSRYFMPESMSPGAAIFDMDNDGDYDVYFINGAWLAESDAGNEPIRNQLYRNDGGPTSPRFVNVTESSGLGDSGYGMGVAVGDIDNDGDDDVYVTNYGPDALYRNNGDGTFTDVTESAGIRNAAWASSADFFDFDADGHLDIFVVNYLELDLKINARDHGGRPEYRPRQLRYRARQLGGLRSIRRQAERGCRVAGLLRQGVRRQSLRDAYFGRARQRDHAVAGGGTS